MTKPVCGEGQRRVRTSAAAIGLAISMGAATMALPKPSNASVISDSNNETHNAFNEQQPETQAIESRSDAEVSAVDAVVDTDAQASTDGLASALMVPSIDKTAVIPDVAPEEISIPSPLEVSAAHVTDIDVTAAKLAAPAEETQYIHYTVRRSETLWQIASAYRTALDEIAQANGISADASLYVGQVLKIPVRDGMNRRPDFNVIADANEFTASRKTLEKAIDVRDYSDDDRAHDDDVSETEHVAYVAPLLEDSSRPDRQNDFNPSVQGSRQEQIASAVSIPRLSLTSRLSPGFEGLAPQSEAFVPSVLSPRLSATHRVAPGETLSSVASRHGVNLDALIAANSITHPDELKPGQELILPTTPGMALGSIATLPRGIAGTEGVSSLVSPTTPRIANPASRIAAVSRRDRSLERAPEIQVSSAPSTIALPPVAETPTVSLASANVTDEGQPVDYAASLRSDIGRLRVQTSASAVGATRESAELAAVPTTLGFDRDSGRSIKPASTREVASLRVNPEFSARDSVREASTAAIDRQPTGDESFTSGVTATPSPAPLIVSSAITDTADTADTADTVAVAPLGSSNYAPVLPPRSVSPDIPALAAVGEYLPSVGSQFNGYVWPAQGVLTSGYGWRWGRMHNGIDIGAPTGTPIVAAAPGVVTYARWNSGGYGNLVEVTHPDGSLTLYAHNNRIVVEEGDQVEQGQHIADMGSTGFSTGPHLHFELHSAGQGVVNPVAYLP